MNKYSVSFMILICKLAQNKPTFQKIFYLECEKSFCQNKTEREIDFIFDQPEIFHLDSEISSEFEEAHRLDIR